MIVDTSILLAIFFREELRTWCAQQLEEHWRNLRMSTVNLTEVLIRAQSRQPHLIQEIREKTLSSDIHFIPPDTTQAEIAAQARLRYPLNLGDCFAYALAKDENSPLLTLDRAFRKTDIEVVLP